MTRSLRFDGNSRGILCRRPPSARPVFLLLAREVAEPHRLQLIESEPDDLEMGGKIAEGEQAGITFAPDSSGPRPTRRSVLHAGNRGNRSNREGVALHLACIST